jgi:hypothetical protein
VWWWHRRALLFHSDEQVVGNAALWLVSQMQYVLLSLVVLRSEAPPFPSLSAAFCLLLAACCFHISSILFLFFLFLFPTFPSLCWMNL